MLLASNAVEAMRDVMPVRDRVFAPTICADAPIDARSGQDRSGARSRPSSASL
jgi:hypothetical protein